MTSKTSKNESYKHSKHNGEKARIREANISRQLLKDRDEGTDEENIDWKEADFDFWRLELEGIY
ncbi:MAG: hypothetical protein ACUVUE_02980 [Candidatus Bathycorpusculaceae bacterium]